MGSWFAKEHHAYPIYYLQMIRFYSVRRAMRRFRLFQMCYRHMLPRQGNVSILRNPRSTLAAIPQWKIGRELRRQWGVREVERFESYLGLPTLVGRAKYQTFSFFKDRVWKKMQGWKGQLL